MKKLVFLLVMPILLLLSGCETPAEPPHVVFDSIGLQKIPLKESGITSYTRFAVSKFTRCENILKFRDASGHASCIPAFGPIFAEIFPAQAVLQYLSPSQDPFRSIPKNA